MPVKFRCGTCNGKLSIATRKIGQAVECPRCRESMTVPSASQIGEELTELLLAVGHSKREAEATTQNHPTSKPANRPGKSLEEMPLFERADYEKLLDPHAKPPKPLPLPTEPPQVAAPHAPPAHADAIVLTRTKATVLAVALVLALGLAFGVGYVVRGYAVPADTKVAK